MCDLHRLCCKGLAGANILELPNPVTLQLRSECPCSVIEHPQTMGHLQCASLCQALWTGGRVCQGGTVLPQELPGLVLSATAFLFANAGVQGGLRAS